MKKGEFEASLSEAEQDLAKLKARYEQWIQGVERVPPVRQREALQRTLRLLRRSQPTNTALRFKFQGVFARWTTLSTYWDRITRQIEEGTFRRDVMKVKRRREAEQARKRQHREADTGPLELELGGGFDFDAEVGAALDALEGPKTDITPASAIREAEEPAVGVFGRPRASPPAPSFDDIGLPTSMAPPAPPAVAGGPPRPAPPRPSRAVPPPPPGRRPPPPPGPARAKAPAVPRPPVPRPPARGATPRGLSDGDVRKVYDKYVEARRRNNERIDNVSLDKLKKRLQKMEPDLRKKHGGRRVDFEVVVKNGRVGLKPIVGKD